MMVITLSPNEQEAGKPSSATPKPIRIDDIGVGEDVDPAGDSLHLTFLIIKIVGKW